MSLSEAKLEANRRNAPLSKGKISEEGRAAVRLNACKHGLTSRQTILPGEDPAEFEKLRDTLTADYAPATAAEQILVAEIVNNYWRLLRARRAEDELFEQCESLTEALKNPASDKVRRYITSIERAWHKSQDALRKEKAQRSQQPKPTVGTVSQKPSTPRHSFADFIREGEEELAGFMAKIRQDQQAIPKLEAAPLQTLSQREDVQESIQAPE